MELHHLTLATGDVAVTHRRDVADATLDDLRSVLAGSGIEPVTGLEIAVMRREAGRAQFRIDDPDGPARALVTASVCWEQGASLAHWRDTVGGPGSAPPTPWLVVAVDYTQLLTHPRGFELAPMLGDLERCLAWLLIED